MVAVDFVRSSMHKDARNEKLMYLVNLHVYRYKDKVDIPRYLALGDQEQTI